MNNQAQEFHDYILYDILDGISDVASKKMFGGYGLYKEGIIFAIITADSELYFKVDETLKEKYKKYDSHPFVYTGHKNKKPIEMPYWILPEEIMENKDKIFEWVLESVVVSMKTKRK